VLAGECAHDVHGGAFAGIVDVGLEAQTEALDRQLVDGRPGTRGFQGVDGSLDLLDHP
jgi:hypothetical protein